MDEKTMIDEARRYREKESKVGLGGVSASSCLRQQGRKTPD